MKQKNKRKGIDRNAPRCPYCGSHTILRSADGIYRENSRNEMLTLLVFILLRYVFLIGYVPTESMEPTLPKGSFILGFRIFEEPRVGDIIVFEKDGALLVKRIAAGPGDRVELSQLTYMTSLPIPVWEEAIIAVPEGCYYVLGDNTQNSWDSRYWEYTFVLRSDIVAVVIPKESLIYTKT